MSVDYNLHKRLNNRASPQLSNSIINEIKKYAGRVMPPAIKVDDIPSELAYERRSLTITPNLHIGQRKLYLSELEFMLLYYEKVKAGLVMDDADASTIIVYAGSAPGHHIYFMQELFPNTKWILIDPAPHELYLDITSRSHRNYTHEHIIHLKTGNVPYNGTSVKIELTIANSQSICDFIRSTEYKIYIIEDYMSIDYATIFRGLKCLFISDIRSTDPFRDDQHKNESQIQEDMVLQQRWHTILNSRRSMLK